MKSFLKALRDAFERLADDLNRALYSKVVCIHFCAFKEAGSNFHHTHVHLLRKGKYPGDANPGGYNGLGHDDATPGMSRTVDDTHNLVSKGDEWEFRESPGDKKKALGPDDLQAGYDITAYFYPAPADGSCAEGYMRIKCKCGDACVTFRRDPFDKWHKQFEK